MELTGIVSAPGFVNVLVAGAWIPVHQQSAGMHHSSVRFCLEEGQIAHLDGYYPSSASTQPMNGYFCLADGRLTPTAIAA